MLVTPSVVVSDRLNAADVRYSHASQTIHLPRTHSACAHRSKRPTRATERGEAVNACRARWDLTGAEGLAIPARVGLSAPIEDRMTLRSVGGRTRRCLGILRNNIGRTVCARNADSLSAPVRNDRRWNATRGRIASLATRFVRMTFRWPSAPR